MQSANSHSRKVRFGLIGAGAIAQAYAQAFRQCEVADLVAVADIRPDAATAMANSFGVPSYNSHIDMAVDADVDAAVVCTPPATHAEICIGLLHNNIHVLCEKPLATDSKAARTMLAAAEDSGMILTMASKFRYVQDVVRAKSIITSGILGDIVLFENVFTSYVSMAGRWNANAQTSGGGVLIDNGTHSIDIVRFFFGPIAEVDVVEGKRSQRLPVEETVQVFVRSESDVIGNIDLSWSINKERESYISIYGSNGTISVGWRESKYRQSSSRDWIVFGNGYNKVDAFRGQLENFAKAIRGEDKLIITAQDSLASVEVIEAAYVALQHRRWTPVCSNGGGQKEHLIREAVAS